MPRSHRFRSGNAKAAAMPNAHKCQIRNNAKNANFWAIRARFHSHSWLGLAARWGALLAILQGPRAAGRLQLSFKDEAQIPLVVHLLVV